MSYVSPLFHQIESLRLINIVYYNPNNVNPTQSYFNPSDCPSQKTLSIVLKVDCGCNLPKDLTLKLVLNSVRDQEYNTIKVDKIKSKVKICQATDTITFTFVDECVPIPHNVKYVKPVYDDSNTAICPIKPEIVTGKALEYCFLLYIKDNKGNKSQFGIPFTARYTGFDTRCDIMCESVEYICHDDSNPNQNYPMSLQLDQHKIDCKINHCVTHCSAPRPIQFYYEN
jgi:hypothetical protein